MVIISRWLFIGALVFAVGMLLAPTYAAAGVADVFITHKKAKGEETTKKEPPTKTERRS